MESDSPKYNFALAGMFRCAILLPIMMICSSVQFKRESLCTEGVNYYYYSVPITKSSGVNGIVN